MTAGNAIPNRTMTATPVMIVKMQRVRAFAPTIDYVEAHLVFFAQDECGAPQGAPDPTEDADLVRPAERLVEDIARNDLENEAQKHGNQQQRGDVLRAAPEPTPGRQRL